jgi:hypothetical protein
MTANVTNSLPGRPRRSLNDTIGHLDQMIDGLSEAIPGTIRDTLQETVGAAVGEGVRAAILEIVSNPEVLALLRTTLVPEAPHAVPVGPVVPRMPLVRTLLKKAWSGVVTAACLSKNAVVSAACAVASGTTRGLNKLAELGQRLRSLRKARRPLLVALAVGAVVAAIALIAPSWVAATLSGLGGAGVTLAAQAGLWLRKRVGLLATAVG